MIIITTYFIKLVTVKKVCSNTVSSSWSLYEKVTAGSHEGNKISVPGGSWLKKKITFLQCIYFNHLIAISIN